MLRLQVCDTKRCLHYAGDRTQGFLYHKQALYLWRFLWSEKPLEFLIVLNLGLYISFNSRTTGHTQCGPVCPSAPRECESPDFFPGWDIPGVAIS